MTTPALGAAKDVRRICGFSSDEIDDQTILDYLAEADRKIRAQHYQKYMADLIYATVVPQTGAVNTVYELYFPIRANSTVSVYVNGVLKTLTTDYTVAGNVITFTENCNLFMSDKILVYYTPEFFDDYANYLASLRILSRSVLESSNGVMLQNYQVVGDNVKYFEKMLAQKPHIGRSIDHMTGFVLW